MKLKNISILLFSLFVTGVFAADLQVTEGETYFSVTQKSDTEFTFINSVSAIQTKVIKTEQEDFLDLIIPFKKGHYYHPLFNWSFSIKNVLPALCHDDPSLRYDELNIKNGGDASLTYRNFNEINSDDHEKVLSDLYAYCRLDTLAMVKILEHLISVTNQRRNYY